jgi:hypothetical protein
MRAEYEETKKEKIIFNNMCQKIENNEWEQAIVFCNQLVLKLISCQDF